MSDEPTSLRAAARAFLKAESRATPGPWRWNINLKSRTVHLDGSPKRGSECVIDFERWGMNGATARFRNNSGLMAPAKCWAFPVAGREHHESWYRTLEHPDADIIVTARNHAPAIIRAAVGVLERIAALGCEYVKAGFTVPCIAIEREAPCAACIALAALEQPIEGGPRR